MMMTKLAWIKNEQCDLGEIPNFLDDADPDSAKEQINKNYGHGGGWHQFHGFTLHSPHNALYSANDPPLYVLAYTQLRDELICFYRGAWVAIIQPNRDFEVAKID
jgi:hypothetical protein